MQRLIPRRGSCSNAYAKNFDESEDTSMKEVASDFILVVKDEILFDVKIRL